MLEFILSTLPIAFVFVFTTISFICVTARHSSTAEQAWDLHLEKKKSEKYKRKEEPHEDP